MTEQQHIAAIDALVSLMQKKMKEHNIENSEDNNSMRHATMYYLHVLHDNGILEGYNVCVYLLGKHWTDATTEEAAICENAVQAMREVIEMEEKHG